MLLLFCLIFLAFLALGSMHLGLSVAALPLLSFLMRCLIPDLWPQIELYVFLALLLGGLFIPIYVVEKKYE